MKRSHRVAWELTHGPIPDSLHVLHRCDNPPCCRPAHLFLGTHVVNMADRSSKNRASREIVHRGESTPSHVLTDAQVAEIRERYAAGGVYQSELAAEFGVGRGHIGRIVRGDRWNPDGLERQTFIHRRNADRVRRRGQSAG